MFDRAKLKGEIEQQNRQLQIMVNNVVAENIDLKQRISRTEQKLTETERTRAETDQRLERLEKELESTRELLKGLLAPKQN